jgi:protocatechuate 3,4-dioxygenase beta subunit
MIRSSIQFAGLALALMLPSAGMQAQGSGSIDGIVVAAGSSTPVPRAKVLLTTMAGRQVATLTATIDGRFLIPDIAPGEYRIVATHDGFVLNTRGSQTTVVSGRRTDVTLRVIPDGAITGRIVDWDGIPVVGIQVQALLFVQDGQGLRRLNVLKTAQTNDLGEYRIYWLPPGQYYVRADPATSDYSALLRNAVTSQTGRSSTPASQQLVPTYFPNGMDVSGARRIDLRAGETSTGVDIRLNNVRARRISGVLSILGSRLTSVRLTPGNSAEGLSDLRTTTPDRSGAFQFDAVVPGAYLLTASALDSDGKAMFGRTPIDVGNADVENVAISLSEGFDLRIRMTIEGRSRRSDEPQLVVNLRPVFTATPFPTVERNGDDVITMHHLMLGDYSVAVLSLRNQLNQNGSLVNGTLYLKSAQYGGADVLTTGLHIEGPPSGLLDITMADGAGSLSGAVLDDQKKPASGVTVVLVPEPRLRGRSDLYKTAMTDAAGKFDISGITPGRYRVFSWEDAEQGSWRYSEFLDSYEDRGQPVRIDGGKSDPITVQLIPPRI